MILTAARITGPTGRPRWRSSILGDSTRSNFFDGVPNHAISPARARNGHGSCGKRSADSAFPTSSHSRCYGTHIDEASKKGNARRKRKSSQIECPRNHGRPNLAIPCRVASPQRPTPFHQTNDTMHYEETADKTRKNSTNNPMGKCNCRAPDVRRSFLQHRSFEVEA